MPILTIKNLRATIGNTKILNGVSLTVAANEVHVIMGPNGSGKSTLLSVLMGSPKYTVTGGSITLDKKSIIDLTPDKRAQAGLFLGFQHPHVVAGVALGNFLRLAHNTIGAAKPNKEQPVAPAQFANSMREEMDRLNIDLSFMSRGINEGFSGGEKKKSEVLQMALLKPTFAFLDEIDSGLDIDALKIVARQLAIIQKRQKMGLIIISHNPKILEFIKPDIIHIMSKGKIIAQGGKELLKKIETTGFTPFLKKK
jgi:Fe-S cluster assembly ATP-binding protein